MASFLEKLKKGMDIENSEAEEETTEEEPAEEFFPVEEDSEKKKASVPTEEISATPLGITTEGIEEKLGGNSGVHIESVLAKTSKSAVKETKKKKTKKKMNSKLKNIVVSEKMIKKEGDENLKIKDSVDFEEPKETKWLESEGQLVVDVYETDGDIVIQSAIAGISPDDLDISIENDVVNIRGKREKTIEKHDRNYFYSECYWGYFSREIILPKEVDAQKAEASMKNGILTIRIPKSEKENKRISVK